MKLLISGSRKASFEKDYERLKSIIEKYAPDATEILHGGAMGIDVLAGVYAAESGLEEYIIRPDYEKYRHKIAPLIRNTQLVNTCDICIAYYIGERSGGTKDTADKARKQGKLLVEVSREGVIFNTPQLRLF